MYSKQYRYDSQRILEYIISQTNTKIVQVDEFCSWLTSSSGLTALLTMKKGNVQHFTNTHYEVINAVNRQFYYRPITQEILSLFVIGDNNLYLGFATEASLVPKSAVLQMIQGSTSFPHWDGLRQNPAFPSSEEMIVPYIRDIIDSETSQHIGYLVILFSERLFIDAYRELLINTASSFVIKNQDGQILHSFYNSAQLPSSTISIMSKNWEYSLSTISSTLRAQKSISLFSIFLFFLIIMFTVITVAVLLSHHIAKPIEKIQKNVLLISQGKFSAVQDIHDSGELGNLSTRIIKMGKDIQRLLEDQSRKEQEKHMLEMQMLQAQINPHFIYNTLNSIKILAVMQGKNTIGKMTETLGSILHICLASTRQTHNLTDELALADSYLYLQNAQLGQSIQYIRHIDPIIRPDSIQVLKFILQPIMENAVLHGFSTLQMEKILTLTVRVEQKSLVIMLEDNGIGMDQSQLVSLNADIPPGNISTLSLPTGHGIGVQNIRRRINLYYGKPYGINFYRGGNGGTSVVIVLPLLGVEDPKNGNTSGCSS